MKINLITILNGFLLYKTDNKNSNQETTLDNKTRVRLPLYQAIS